MVGRTTFIRRTSAGGVGLFLWAGLGGRARRSPSFFRAALSIPQFIWFVALTLSTLFAVGWHAGP